MLSIHRQIAGAILISGAIMTVGANAQTSRTTTIASCASTSGQMEIRRVGYSKLTFTTDGLGQSTPVTVTNAGKTYLESAVLFHFVTASGNFIDLHIPVAGGGRVSMWDRGVIGNECLSEGARVDMAALNQFVADAQPKPRYLFATCRDSQGRTTTMTVRQGMLAHTAIFEAELPRASEEISYVATKFDGPIDDSGYTYLRFYGEGRYTVWGLGTHNHEIENITLRSSTSGERNDLFFTKAELESPEVDPLQSCKINNLWYVKRLLGE
jgi:hypothetical protein